MEMKECKLLIRTADGIKILKSGARTLYEYGRYLARTNSKDKPLAIYGARGRLWKF